MAIARYSNSQADIGGSLLKTQRLSNCLTTFLLLLTFPVSSPEVHHPLLPGREVKWATAVMNGNPNESIIIVHLFCAVRRPTVGQKFPQRNLLFFRAEKKPQMERGRGHFVEQTCDDGGENCRALGNGER